MPKKLKLKLKLKLNSYVMIEKFENYMQKGKFLLNYEFFIFKKPEKNMIHVIINFLKYFLKN